MKNFTKQIKIWKVCSTDNERPSLSYVQFRNGYALASDAHMAVRVPLELLADVSEEEIAKLNGREIRGKMLEDVSKNGNIVVEDDALICTQNGVATRYKLRQDGEDGNVPNIEALFEREIAKASAAVGEIVVNPEYIKRLSDAMGICKGMYMSMRFNGATCAILCTCKDTGIIGLLMPAIY